MKHRWLHHTGIAIVPYVAVILGLFVARSAWAAILLYHAGIAAFFFAGDWRRRLLMVRRGWCAGLAVAGAVTGALAGIALYVLWPHIDATDGGLGFLLSKFGLTGKSWIAFAVYYSTIHPFLEELHWRSRKFPEGSGVSWLDAAFGGYHVLVLSYFIGSFWIAVSFVVLTLISWLWRLTARRLDGLGVPLVSHAVADASIVLAATFIVQ